MKCTQCGGEKSPSVVDGLCMYCAMQRPYAPTKSHDTVNKPKHYTSDPSGVECIEITRHRTFNIGNAIKYLWRAGMKDTAPQIEDLNKAVFYIFDEIKRLGGKITVKLPEENDKTK